MGQIKPPKWAKCTCQTHNQHVLSLRRVLAHYPIEQLGTWSFVLIPSADWRDLVRDIKNPGSPALTEIERRTTVFEEVLFSPRSSPMRSAELLNMFNIPMEALLDLAVSHELGHALCQEKDEERTNTYGRNLRARQALVCHPRQSASKSSAAENGPSPTITVQIRNYAQAPPPILAGAEHEAARILGEAGVLVVWLECPVRSSYAIRQGPCEKATEASDLKLRVLTAPIQGGDEYIVFGFTINPTLSSVYYDEYALRRARNDNSEFEIPIILGAVMAHELGHLLLGSNSHSGSGIMQPRWDQQQAQQIRRRALLFTYEQSRIMREEARNRIDHMPGTSMSSAK